MERVLLATDGSPHALRAAEYLHRWAAGRTDVTVTILYVYPYVEEVPLLEGAVPPEGLPPHHVVRQRAAAALQATRIALDLPEGQVQSLVAAGLPVPEILYQAERHTLVVMGSRGLNVAGELIFGSVSHAVLHRAHCPVLVVR